MSKNRGPDPNEKTLRMLCGIAAGMCQFRGCNKRLFYDGVTTTKFINSNVAHIIASSPDGVRGDPVLSHQQSDKIENLMLMCYDHHKLIDDQTTGETDFPVAMLQEMKREHEARLSKLCGYFNAPKTELFCFSSPIRGKEVSIDVNLAGKAVLPKKQPITPYGQNKCIKSVCKYGTTEYWKDLENQLLIIVQEIKNIKSVDPQVHFSLFPLAPMPLIAKLGELISDKTPTDVYQKTRVPDTWEWQAENLTNKFDIQTTQLSVGSVISLVVELTSEISDERVNFANSPNVIYRITAKNKGVDSIKSAEDLKEFWMTYQSVMDDIVNDYGKTCTVNLFMAAPVSAVFEIGRRYMPMVYPKIEIFDDTDEGFKTSLSLGG